MGSIHEKLYIYGIWAGFTSNGEPLTLDEKERHVIRTMLIGQCCNELPLIEETEEQSLLEQSRPLYVSGQP